MLNIVINALRLLVKLSLWDRKAAEAQAAGPPPADPPPSPPADPPAARSDSPSTPRGPVAFGSGVPPRGRFGGAEDPRVWEAIERARDSGAVIDDREEIKRRVGQAVHAAMAEWGFAPDRGPGAPDARGGRNAELPGQIVRHARQYVDFMPPMHMVVNAGFGYRMDWVMRRIPAVENVWEDLRPLLHLHPDPWSPTLSFGVYDWFPAVEDEPGYDLAFNGLLIIPTPDGIAEYGARFAALYRDHLLPVMDRFRDLRTVCDLVLEELRPPTRVQALLSPDGIMARRLILARLAGDARYDELYDYEMGFEAEYLAAAEQHPQFANYPRVLRELHQRLRSIPPLENPVLD